MKLFDNVSLWFCAMLFAVKFAKRLIVLVVSENVYINSTNNARKISQSKI